MVFDICVRVKDLGDVFGSYIKSTAHSVYLRDALIGKNGGVSVSLFKLEKKYIVSVRRMAIPPFENFTEAQLHQVMGLNVLEYTETAQKIIASRQSSQPDVQESNKQIEAIKKVTKEKKETKVWNQFAANKEMFGVEPEFSMDEYAESIDRNAPGYKEIKVMSQKIAREIMSQTGSDLHIQEEREQSSNVKISEDQLYSSVQATSKWDSANEKKVVEKQAVEAVKPVVVEQEDKSKEYQAFETSGWSIIAAMGLAKKKQEDALKAKLQMSIDLNNPKPVVQASVEKIAKPVEIATKSDSNRQSKPKDKKSNGNNRKPSDKPTSIEHKSPKIAPLSNSLKFSSADQCVKHVLQSFKSNNSDKIRNWGTGKTISEAFLTHSKPLEMSPFSPERLDEIKGFIIATSIQSSLYKN